MTRPTLRASSGTLLTPALRRYLAEPLLPMVPRSFPANGLTLIAHLCVAAVPLAALTLGQTRPAAAALLIFALVFLFAVGDELDGMQAVRTRTTSSRGEFLDHYLDSFVPGVLLYSAYPLYGVSSTALLLPTIAGTALTAAALYQEQLTTGAIVFERVSTTESLAAGALILGLRAVPGVYSAARQELLPGCSVLALLLLCASLAVFLPTAIRCFRRSRTPALPWWLLAAGLVVLCGALLAAAADLARAAAIVTLYGSAHVGAVIRRHLGGGRAPLPDPIAPTALLGASILAPGYATLAQAGVLAYLGVRCAWILAAAVLRPAAGVPAPKEG